MNYLVNFLKLSLEASYAFLKFLCHEIKCLILIVICFLLRPYLSKFFDNRAMWIIGENSGDVQKDNGYCFFKYCCESEISQDVFFIAKKKYIHNDDFLRLNDKNILIYGSVRHIAYLFFAEVFIYSQSHRDILYDPLFSLIAKGKKKIFLQHGVTGLKKAIAYLVKHRNEADILSVVSDYERFIFVNLIEAESQRIKITGFARFDYLFNTAQNRPQKQICFIPTWRDWIKKENFFNSVFYKNISGLIADESLTAFLEKENIILKFYLHKIMHKYLSSFVGESGQIKFIEFGQESVQQLLSESHLLITDYSSVSWDFYYLNKPVIFYQFDIEDYIYHRGSYLDLKKELFGDCVYNVDDLVNLIKAYNVSDFKEKDKFKVERTKFFKYIDHSNCRRIFEEIMKLKKSR